MRAQLHGGGGGGRRGRKAKAGRGQKLEKVRMGVEELGPWGEGGGGVGEVRKRREGGMKGVGQKSASVDEGGR